MQFRNGQKIIATSHGRKLSGLITEIRPVFVKTDGCILITIALNEPFNSFGKMLDSFQIAVRYDGSPSTYTRESDKVISVE